MSAMTLLRHTPLIHSSAPRKRKEKKPGLFTMSAMTLLRQTPLIHSSAPRSNPNVVYRSCPFLGPEFAALTHSLTASKPRAHKSNVVYSEALRACAGRLGQGGSGAGSEGCERGSGDGVEVDVEVRAVWRLLSTDSLNPNFGCCSVWLDRVTLP
jgi:hypothetical protein